MPQKILFTSRHPAGSDHATDSAENAPQGAVGLSLLAVHYDPHSSLVVSYVLHRGLLHRGS